jgi:hypothetical protein
MLLFGSDTGRSPDSRDGSKFDRCGPAAYPRGVPGMTLDDRNSAETANCQR